MRQSGRPPSWEAKAHGAAVRLHDVRGERSNVPRDSAVLYGAEDNVIKKVLLINSRAGSQRGICPFSLQRY